MNPTVLLFAWIVTVGAVVGLFYHWNISEWKKKTALVGIWLFVFSYALTPICSDFLPTTILEVRHFRVVKKDATQDKLIWRCGGSSWYETKPRICFFYRKSGQIKKGSIHHSNIRKSGKEPMIVTAHIDSKQFIFMHPLFLFTRGQMMRYLQIPQSYRTLRAP